MENKEQPKEIPRPKNIMDVFLGLGKNMSPADRLNFTYYLLWIIFLAFVFMFITNMWRVINGDWYSLIWAMVGFAISCLQYFNLQQMYHARKSMKENPMPEQKEEKLESVDEMLEGFEDSKKMKGGKNNV